MERFIGTKLLNAKPMTRGEWCALRGWPLPADENGDDAGFVVEYLDSGKPNMDGYAGYVSWTPAEQFENAYRPATGMNFGLAIEAMKKGLKVARSGWNGKGMWLVLIPGTPVASLREGTPYRNALQQEECEILPHIDMWTVNASGRRAMLPGWVASQSDMLADDWMLAD